MATNTDIVNNLTGNFGKWQLRAILIIFLCKIPTAWYLSIILFTAPTPKSGEFWCKPPDTITNHTEWILQSHPMHKLDSDKEFQIDFCKIYKDGLEDNGMKIFQFSRNENLTMLDDQRKIIPCEDFHFESEFHSVIAEYNLVCSRRLLLTVSQSFHIFGLLVGGVAAYFMLKSTSPKSVMLIGIFAQIFFGIMCGQTKYFEFHVVFRCLVAAACSMMCVSGQMIIADITGGRAKTIAIVLFELFWSIGLIILPALSIFFNNWSHLYLAVSLPTLVLVFLHRYIPDSPRWLLLHGRLKKAKEILLKSAATNKRVIPDDFDHLLSTAARVSSTQQKKEVPWFSLWYHDKCLLLVIYYAWAIFILLFNTMVLNISSYGQKFIHFNTVVMGFSEVFGACIGLYLILYTRRKWIWIGLLNIVAGLSTYGVWLIPSTLKDTQQIALTMIPCIALKITVSSAISILTACTADLVAPEKKKVLMLSAGIWGRAWILWAPFVGVLNKFGPLVPISALAMLTVVGGLLCAVIGHNQRGNLSNQMKNTNVELKLDKEKFILLESKS